MVEGGAGEEGGVLARRAAGARAGAPVGGVVVVAGGADDFERGALAVGCERPAVFVVVGEDLNRPAGGVLQPERLAGVFELAAAAVLAGDGDFSAVAGGEREAIAREDDPLAGRQDRRGGGGQGDVDADGEADAADVERLGGADVHEFDEFEVVVVGVAGGGFGEGGLRGIVVDFFTLEISTKWSEETTVEEYAKLGDKAREWYRETLASGFGLTRNQEVEVAGKIREFRKTDLKDFKEELASFRTFIERWEAVDAEARPTVYSLDLESGPSIQEGFGLWRDYYLLRNLCVLDEVQKEMIGCIGEKGKWTWVDGTERTLDYGTTESYGDLSDPFADGDSILYEAGKIFPLSMGQVDRLGPFHDEAVSPHTPKAINGEYLEQAKFLTAPQLKTLLLFDPEMAGRLIKELAE